MSLPKYIVEEVSHDRLFTVPSDSPVQTLNTNYYRYMFRLVVPKASTITITKKKAEKIIAYAKRMGGNGTIICESVISYRDVADWKYIPLPCVVIGVTDPVAKEIEDCIEFEGNLKKLRRDFETIEPCVLKFLPYDEPREYGKRYGYVRGYHNEFNWCGTWFDGEIERTEPVKAESQFVYRNVVSKFVNGVTDINKLTEYKTEEIYLRYTGNYAEYKIRLIARKGDYNLYLYCYAIGE